MELIFFENGSVVHFNFHVPLEMAWIINRRIELIANLGSQLEQLGITERRVGEFVEPRSATNQHGYYLGDRAYGGGRVAQSGVSYVSPSRVPRGGFGPAGKAFMSHGSYGGS